MRRSGLRSWLEHGARGISRQHRQLDVLHEMVVDALATQRVHTARENFDRFADALESHLALEEAFHFPTLEALCPWLSESLGQLKHEHEVMRSQSARLRMLLIVGDAESAASDLERLIATISSHEESEELLMLRASQPEEPH